MRMAGAASATPGASWKRLEQAELEDVIPAHARFLSGAARGLRANLAFHDLAGLDLEGRDLSQADLSAAKLNGARMGGINLRNANLFCTDLRMASIQRADLSRTDLRGACLRGAQLSESLLIDADIREGTLLRSSSNSELDPAAFEIR